MPLPINRLKKQELIWLNSHRCLAHRHTYLGHYACFLAENPERERIGFLDIETSNLDPIYGYMISYCIKDSQSSKIYEGVISKREVNNKGLDRRITASCIEDMLKFDKVITFNGTRFDLKFIRTRAFRWKIKFPYWGELLHRDIYYVAKAKIGGRHKTQEVVTKLLFGETEKTHIDPFKWVEAATGDKKMLEMVLDHNRRDVRDLERIYYFLINYTKGHDNSV